MTDRNCLTYWFPKLRDANMLVPRTEVVDAGDRWHDLLGLFDDPTRHPDSHTAAEAVIAPLIVGIGRAAERIGGTPVFLRTGQGSGKHDFDNCCRLTDPNMIRHHVVNLVQWSEMVDFMGLSWRYWCVREWLPVRPVAVLPAYGNMPLVKEVRCFVRDGAVICAHPYWPAGAVADGFGMPKLSPAGGLRGPSRHADAGTLAAAIHGVTPTPDDEREWRPLAERVAAAFAGDGAWSVDLLPTDRGWQVTDMAVAADSHHWEGCPQAASFGKRVKL